MIYTPHNYQEHSTNHIIANVGAGLFLDMGLGKTVSTLTAIDILKYEMFQTRKVLIIAPKFVAINTWPEEIEKWDHTKHLTYSVVCGTAKQRIRALKQETDVYIINRENVAWLVALYGGGLLPFDMLVIDELSSFKNPNSKRFKALKRVRGGFERIVGLTGTPAPNGMPDIWSQIFLLDGGKRLGGTVTSFRREYCTEGLKKGHVVYKWHMNKEAEKRVYDKIGDICISMKTEDYLELPELMTQEVAIEFDDKTLKAYKDFRRDRVLEMDVDEQTGEVTAVNAAALSTKLQQFANGAIYDEDRNVVHIHDFKLEALENIVEEAQGDPILVFYSFQHDLERILASKKIGEKVRVLKGVDDIKQWNKGEIEVMAVHPASAGHGLNLQHGGCNMVWFGLNWSLELFQQALKRIHRQGQTRPVKMFILMVKHTIDVKIARSLEGKKEGQDSLMDAVKAIVKMYRK